MLSIRQGTMKVAGAGLDAFVEITRRRIADGLRWSAFAKRSMQVLTVLLVPWAVWVFITRYPLYRVEPWRAIVGFGVAAVILAGCFAWQRRRRAKLESERDRFEALVAERTLT